MPHNYKNIVKLTPKTLPPFGRKKYFRIKYWDLPNFIKISKVKLLPKKCIWGLQGGLIIH